MNKTILETARLSLREITHDDLDDLLQIWGDAETLRFFPKTLDRREMSEWIDRNLKRYESYGHGLWAVILKDTQQFVGDCGLVIKNFWGRGLAAEAARGCMDYAFNQLGRRRVISMIRPENIPSRRVAERNGLQIEKKLFWRGYDHYVYAITSAAAHRS